MEVFPFVMRQINLAYLSRYLNSLVTEGVNEINSQNTI